MSKSSDWALRIMPSVLKSNFSPLGCTDNNARSHVPKLSFPHWTLFPLQRLVYVSSARPSKSLSIEVYITLGQPNGGANAHCECLLTQLCFVHHPPAALVVHCHKPPPRIKENKTRRPRLGAKTGGTMAMSEIKGKPLETV
jgi:hypothetical protein